MTIVKLLNCYFELSRNKLSYIVNFTNSIQRFNYSTIKRLNLGFTIIELLIVMSLLGIATTLVSAAYLSFEKRERVKSAALDLKSNLRLAQNKALSGDKGIPGSGEECPAGNTLVGWFIRLDKNGNSYDLAGSCQPPTGEDTEFAAKTIQLPEGISLRVITYHGVFDSDLQATNILFRPLEREVYAFREVTPPFIDNNGNLQELIVGEGDQESLQLTLSGFDTEYDVNISTSGEVNEKKL